VDLSAADKLGIRVESIAYSPDGVADYAVMLILMALRNAKGMLGRAETGDFSLDCARSPDLREMTVGVVGAGRIGQGVIARLRAFGCRISAYGNANAGETLRASFDEWIGQCDVLTFHLPLTARTRHILNGRNMRQVKDGAYIVNTGRGGLIETEALLTALKAGKLRGAALDVVEGEEDIFYGGHRGERIEKGVFSELCKMSNVIITPHAAFYTRRALIETVENTILKCLEYEGSKKWTG
jgi:D-specific alpha-keto acid dehydrogenase